MSQLVSRHGRGIKVPVCLLNIMAIYLFSALFLSFILFLFHVADIEHYNKPRTKGSKDA